MEILVEIIKKMSPVQLMWSLIAVALLSGGGGHLTLSTLDSIFGPTELEAELTDSLSELSVSVRALHQAVLVMNRSMSAQVNAIERIECQIEYARNGWGDDWRECWLEPHLRTHELQYQRPLAIEPIDPELGLP